VCVKNGNNNLSRTMNRYTGVETYEGRKEGKKEERNIKPHTLYHN